MRVPLVAAALVFVVLAGCSEGKPKADPDGTGGFDDIDVKVTDTTGVLLGVVVDDAIRPLPGVSVAITGPEATAKGGMTDAEGRFFFDELPPGTYFIAATLLNYRASQATAEVVAGEEDPPVVRVQLLRLFDQEPFTEMVPYDGFLACAYSFQVSSTCVNDYTRVTGRQCLPANLGCYCDGGCFRDQNLSARGGNIREYISQVGPGWQAIIWEETWRPTSDAGENMGFTISYFDRPTAGHWFATENGANPLRLELLVGEKHSSAQTQANTPEIIPAEGYDQIFTFFGAGDRSLVLNQGFKSFETHFYYGLPPDGWSFVNGDPLPF